ncbi:MAG TPA: hypothetical protein VHD35_03905 [Chitinophagaceae bacterium]|nr:hypothetical protein [Chitinophagaceae bacterium]
MLKAKILKCSDPEAWYSDRIGEIFEVFEQSKFLPFSSVFDLDHKAKIISNDDASFFQELTQSELEARASVAADLFREGEVTRVEVFRTEVDAVLGRNSGDLKFEKNTDFKDGTM